MKHKLQSLTSLPFLLCLGVLLLNDFYLKETFHNGLTGKLSDFCGLYIFPIFWSAFFYKKKNEIYIITALLFVLWKSPFSQTFIDFFSLVIYPISRVVDITDLWALGVLPISYVAGGRAQVKLNLNPYILSIISFLSFCSTSAVPHFQEFENPQYILLKSSELTFRNVLLDRVDQGKIQLDSVDLIELKGISLAYTPLLKDEFQKVQVLKDLDKTLMRYVKHDAEWIRRGAILDSLTIKGKTEITVEKEKYRDILSFKNTRLHGSFARESYDGKPLIQGLYRNGIEDSIWLYYNRKNEIHRKEIYNHGELSQVILYKNAKEIDTEIILTRAQKVERKQFQLGLLFVLMLGVLFLLIRDHNSEKTETPLTLARWKKIVGVLVLPILPILLNILYSDLFPNTYGKEEFLSILKWIPIYLINFAFFLVIIFTIRPRKVSTFMLYAFLLSLILMTYFDVQYVMALVESMK